TVSQQVFMLLRMVIRSKGAAGVTGSGFSILASTLSALGVVPVAGIVIILGLDRLMSEGRAITNLSGNTIGTILISKWQKKL
ncbi:cation:dicarboxylate symporter family transporter, partial [Francisella tularensis]|uniref:cation:dicarboxylate symporter family transporter n=1 Tax=Francisella tularensis TaxID=263 RepID=UPI002381B2E4